MNRHINLNTGLLGIMLALGGWNLSETINAGQRQAKLEEGTRFRDQSLSRIEEELKIVQQRLSRLEAQSRANRPTNP